MSKKRRVEETNVDEPLSSKKTMFNMTPPDNSKDWSADDKKTDNLPCSHRTSLPKLIELNNRLSNEQRKAIQTMGFGSMLQLKIKALDNNVMSWLLQNFDLSTRVLKVCGKSIHITLDKVKSALGIPCTIKDFTYKEGSNMGILTHGKHLRRETGQYMNLAELESELTKSSGDEFKVRYMMCLCARVLFPKYGTTPELGLLNYMVDLDHVQTYNWGGVVLERLVDSVLRYQRKKSKVTGCILLLEVIFLTELASMYPKHDKYFMPNKAYVEQWSQEEANAILQMFENNKNDTKLNAEMEKNKDNLKHQPLSGEATFTSEGISLMRLIVDQVQLFNGRLTSLEGAVIRLIENSWVKSNGDYGSLRQENATGPFEEVIPNSENKVSSHEQQNLKKSFDSCNLSNPDPSIKQGKQKIPGPRVVNTETCKINEDGSENSKELSDVYSLICEAMEYDTGFQYLFDESLDLSETVVQFEYDSLTRNLISCLKPGEWLNDGVINCVAYVNWFDRRLSPDASQHWNLPAWFSSDVQTNLFTNERINKDVFGPKGLFKGLPSRCSSISIPIHDSDPIHNLDHWLLCKVDFEKQIIEICDTMRTTESDKRRLSLIENVVIRLENISKLWQGAPFRHFNWHDTFEYRYSRTTPTQPNGYDCGLYVCLRMMFPGGINRALTKEESDITRRKLASRLLYHPQNLAFPREPIKVWVTPLPDTETCHPVPTKYKLADMTLGGILKQVYKVRGMDTSGDTIELEGDEDLKDFTQRHIDRGIHDINIEVAWNLKEDKSVSDHVDLTDD